MKTKEEKLELKARKQEKKRFFKWLKKKRKTYLKFFKSWAPWDMFYFYIPIKMILQDFYEYYEKGDWVAGVPVITDEAGNIIEKDDRAKTIKTTLDLLQKAEDLEDTLCDSLEESNTLYEEACKTYIEAFSYMAKYMNSWWD